MTDTPHPEAYALHGMPLPQLIAERDFISTVWFAWTGQFPSDAEKRLIDACFTACVDHGEAPPSAQACRIVASCGKPLADAVAAGVLAFGPRHGNAAGAASAWVRDRLASGDSPDAAVRQSIASGQRIPGIGHPVYETDPRTTVLFDLAKTTLPETRHIAYLRDVAENVSHEKGKPMPVNVDGAIGAIIADMGAPSELADAIFLAARTAGLIMHARSEAAASKTYRRGTSV